MRSERRVQEALKRCVRELDAQAREREPRGEDVDCCLREAVSVLDWVLRSRGGCPPDCAFIGPSA